MIEMEGGGRRISASPRPCNGRRVVAKKRPRVGSVDGFVNSVKKLQRREISSKRDRAFTMSDAQERFRNIRLQVSSPAYFLTFFFPFFLCFCFSFFILVLWIILCFLMLYFPCL